MNKTIEGRSDHSRRARGFTLIELLVVIAIIGILASLILVALGNAREKARSARIKADVEQVRVLAEDINDTNGGASYVAPNPATCAGSVDIGTLCTDVGAQNGAAGGDLAIVANDAFCAAAVLANGTTYCSDSNGNFTGTYDGGTGGTCAAGNPTACAGT